MRFILILTIALSVTSIENNAFSDCSSLKQKFFNNGLSILNYLNTMCDLIKEHNTIHYFLFEFFSFKGHLHYD